MEAKRKVYWFSLLFFLTLSGYWVYRIWGLISFEIVKEEENYLGSLAIYLLSWLIVFLIVNLFAWFNFKFLFLNWRNSQLNTYLFWATQLGALALIFELFQWLSQYEPDVMKENLILTLVIALYFLAFTWFFDMIETKKNQAKLIQQKERAELSLLQSQLNPHFLFNALNTSYSTAISEGSEKAANQILQLSELMRFALEKSKIDYIQMSDEIGFLEKYIELQKSRFHHLGTANVQIRINWDGIEVKISPMLIQPFLENAFKFTALNRPSEKPVLLVDLKVEEGKLVLNVDNSYIGQHVQENKGTGNGIHLVRQRLKSLYPQKHDLEIIDMGDVFKVFLKIDLIG